MMMIRDIDNNWKLQAHLKTIYDDESNATFYTQAHTHTHAHIS